jgi:hypothetical protein
VPLECQNLIQQLMITREIAAVQLPLGLPFRAVEEGPRSISPDTALVRSEADREYGLFIVME